MTKPEGELDRTTNEAWLEAANGLTAKVVEAIVLLHTHDQMTAAMIGGAAGGMAKAVLEGGHRMLRLRGERLDEAIRAAESESGGLRVNELVERCLSYDDERRFDLLLTALEAASHEANRDKVRAYGRIAASGVMSDYDTKVIERRRVFDTLAALDDVDLRVLMHMAPESRRPWLLFLEEDDGTEEPRVREMSRVLAEELPDIREMLDPAHARLTGLGLIVEHLNGQMYIGSFALSGFAHTCVQELMRGGDAGS